MGGSGDRTAVTSGFRGPVFSISPLQPGRSRELLEWDRLPACQAEKTGWKPIPHLNRDRLEAYPTLEPEHVEQGLSDGLRIPGHGLHDEEHQHNAGRYQADRMPVARHFDFPQRRT